MGKPLIILIATFLVVSIFCYAAENLISNSSFEEPKDAEGDNPIGWWSWNSDYNGIAKKIARTGRQAVYFSKPRGFEEHHGMVYTYKKVKPGAEYIFSCYVRNSERFPLRGGSFGQVSIEWKKMNKEIDRTWGATFGPSLLPSNWTFVTMSGIAPQGADNCNFVIQYFDKDGGGTFYVDDAVAEERVEEP